MRLLPILFVACPFYFQERTVLCTMLNGVLEVQSSVLFMVVSLDVNWFKCSLDFFYFVLHYNNCRNQKECKEMKPSQVCGTDMKFS